jgi:hypothetical protein
MERAEMLLGYLSELRSVLEDVQPLVKQDIEKKIFKVCEALESELNL